MSIELYLDLFQKAVDRVESIYFSRELTFFGSHLNVELRQELIRYGERIFCYELYHQLRPLVDGAKKCGQIDPDIYLQGEIKKPLLNRINQVGLGVTGLDRVRFPDLLLHDPTNAKHQELVVEIKNDPNLSVAALKKDLRKIDLFISNYHFNLGIFLAVSIKPEDFQKIFGQIAPQQLPSFGKIIVMSKHHAGEQTIRHSL